MSISVASKPRAGYKRVLFNPLLSHAIAFAFADKFATMPQSQFAMQCLPSYL